MAENDDGPRARFAVSLHGPHVTIEDAVKAGDATKDLLESVSEHMGHTVTWRVASIQFQCDGCHVTRPDRPRPDEGWTHREGDDFCPTCSSEPRGPEETP